jgi:SH3 domain protein
VTLVAAATLLGASDNAFAQAWVSGDRVLNLRTGAGENDHAIGVLRTGDPVTILRRDAGWVEVRDERGRTGWVLGSYLTNETPPQVLLAQRVGELETELETARRESQTLRDDNETLRASDGKASLEIEQLTRENMEYKAGERWPFLITGASILSAGLLLGLIGQWAFSKRSRSGRIRF